MREELGSHGYQWLCACAIYPGLRWPLTLALGDALAAAMERPSPDEEETLALARLEWFRIGALPEDLRPALVDDLEPACAEAARATVGRFLLSMSLAGDCDEADEMFAQPKLPGWRSAVSAFFGKLPEEARENDPICVEFMLGGSSTPALQRLDRAAAHLTGASVWRMASLRNLFLGALATGALSAAIWVSLAPDESSAIPRSATLAFAPGAAFQECPDCPEMVMLPAGKFLMGSPESEEGRPDAEAPQREVIVYAFAMSRTEVTFDQWAACVAGGGCNPSPGDQGWGPGLTHEIFRLRFVSYNRCPRRLFCVWP